MEYQHSNELKREEQRTIFFFIAASAFASAFASFFIESFSNFVCASKLNVPTLACSASNLVIQSNYIQRIAVEHTHHQNNICGTDPGVLLVTTLYTVLSLIQIHSIQVGMCTLSNHNQTKSFILR